MVKSKVASHTVTNIDASLPSESFALALVMTSSAGKPVSARDLIVALVCIINIAAGTPLLETSATRKRSFPSGRK